MQHDLYSKIKNLQKIFNNNRITSQQLVNEIHQLQALAMKSNINLDNYLYREGIFNKQSSLRILTKQIKKYSRFPAKVTPYKEAYQEVKHSKQDWFENYAIHQGSHDLIKSDIDAWKIRSLLNCILCDVYVGSDTEDANYNLSKEE